MPTGPSTGATRFSASSSGRPPGAVNAANGEWALNSFTFDSQANPAFNGQQVIILLNNFGTTASFYDNVTLVASVPEPATAIFGVGLGIICLLGQRRHRRSEEHTEASPSSEATA